MTNDINQLVAKARASVMESREAILEARWAAKLVVHRTHRQRAGTQMLLEEIRIARKALLARWRGLQAD